MDSLCDACIFPTQEASSGSWQVEIDAGDCEKVALTSHHGLYQLARMPFGLAVPQTSFNGQWTSYYRQYYGVGTPRLEKSLSFRKQSKKT